MSRSSIGLRSISMTSSALFWSRFVSCSSVAMPKSFNSFNSSTYSHAKSSFFAGKNRLRTSWTIFGVSVCMSANTWIGRSGRKSSSGHFRFLSWGNRSVLAENVNVSAQNQANGIAGKGRRSFHFIFVLLTPEGWHICSSTVAYDSSFLLFGGAARKCCGRVFVCGRSSSREPRRRKTKKGGMVGV